MKSAICALVLVIGVGPLMRMEITIASADEGIIKSVMRLRGAEYAASGNEVRTMHWSENGRTVLVGTSVGLIEVWDVASGGLVRTKRVFDRPCRDVHLAASGSYIVAVSDLGDVKCLSVHLGDLGNMGPPILCGRHVHCRSSNALYYLTSTARSGALLLGLEKGVDGPIDVSLSFPSVCHLDDSGAFVSYVSEETTIVVYSVGDEATVYECDLPLMDDEGLHSPTIGQIRHAFEITKHIVIALESGAELLSQVLVLDAERDEVVYSDGPSIGTVPVDVSPSGASFVYGLRGCRPAMVTFKNLEIETRFDMSDATAFAFSRDGRRIAIASRTGEILLFDLYKRVDSTVQEKELRKDRAEERSDEP